MNPLQPTQCTDSTGRVFDIRSLKNTHLPHTPTHLNAAAAPTRNDEQQLMTLLTNRGLSLPMSRPVWHQWLMMNAITDAGQERTLTQLAIMRGYVTA